MTLTTDPRPAAPTAASDARRRGLAARLWALTEVRWAAAATLLFALGVLAQLADAPAPVWWTLYLACYATGGWEPALAGLRALRARTLDVDLLMIVAALGAAGIGQVLDGALLIVIFATSGALEAFATARTADSVRALLDLAPERAARVRADGVEEVVPTADLDVGDVIRVRPGERIGADAVVVDGASDVDQAGVTGEPLPAPKHPGDEVYAGTVNGAGSLLARVHRPAAESVVARIVALVEEASATKARTQLFIEKVEQRYSVGVVVATLALFAVPLAFGAALQPTLLRAMTFMIVASPCAVVLATMPPLLSAIALAGRHGVLVKSAVVVERLADTDLVVFDKTGTLTEGTPRVAEVNPVPDGPDEPTLLRLAAAAEQPSEHPLAGALLAAARERGLTLPPAADFTATPGRGVAATVAGHRVLVGSPALLDGSAPTPAARLVDAAQASGRTAVVVQVDGAVAGVLGLADRARPAAAETVAALTSLTGSRPALLTGDNAGAAGRLAADTGITEVHAGLLPEDKVDRVRARQRDGRRVLLVGDGINDAPALAAADTGVAMGRHGSDLALRTADAVLVRDDLAALPALLGLARRARRLVVANLVVAATFIVVLVTWDLVGHLPLPLGVAGHEGSTIIVGLNGLRLLSSRAWRRAGETR
ncbi:heavy metal translocating P-type ATPase [Micromonospora soli]|uniref:heavy metal translocating P-type ATPase n=1 Tax=Micromonospora sp. NBRC 110009 TaxID=3061627 RepID=UPI002672A834|nr:heavy metal translocating P-type ATPase [Micromonospora sp. NBRC 110009]WKT97076.1 heavy metal translocating P-type ATPase [Micromonospora sp. NBRC 110009]